LSAARARQLPNLVLLGGYYTDEFPGIEVVGLPGLEPTNVTNVELTWTRRLETSGLELRVGAFTGRTEDIQSISGGNVGSSDTAGLEASVGGSLGDHLRWDVNLLEQDVDDNPRAGLPFSLTYIDYENTTPERVLKGHFGWTGERFEVDGYLRYQSDTTGVRILDPLTLEGVLTPVPSHVAIDTRLGYALNDRLQLALTGINLTRSAQRQTAAPAVERQVFATVEFRF
jgi:outer membrane receptor protein involved in Fe transport